MEAALAKATCSLSCGQATSSCQSCPLRPRAFNNDHIEISCSGFSVDYLWVWQDRGLLKLRPRHPGGETNSHWETSLWELIGGRWGVWGVKLGAQRKCPFALWLLFVYLVFLKRCSMKRALCVWMYLWCVFCIHVCAGMYTHVISHCSHGCELWSRGEHWLSQE